MVKFLTMVNLRLRFLLLTAVFVMVSTANADTSNKAMFRAAFNPAAAEPPILYIVNGMQAGVGEFPWQISLEKLVSWSIFSKSYGAVCGGTIISPRRVVTAAHCIEEGATYRIVAGVTRLGSKEIGFQSEDVKRAIVHPDWNSTTLVNDVAVLILERPLVFTREVSEIDLAELPRDANLSGTCTATGFGKLAQNKENTSRKLMRVDLEIVPTYECFRRYIQVQNIKIDKHRICAGGRDGKAACNGDSGGPLICRSGDRTVFAGITSFGVVCGDNHPTVFTNVAYYSKWILEQNAAANVHAISLMTLFVAFCLSTMNSWRL